MNRNADEGHAGDEGLFAASVRYSGRAHLFDDHSGASMFLVDGEGVGDVLGHNFGWNVHVGLNPPSARP